MRRCRVRRAVPPYYLAVNAATCKRNIFHALPALPYAQSPREQIEATLRNTVDPVNYARIRTYRRNARAKRASHEGRTYTAPIPLFSMHSWLRGSLVYHRRLLNNSESSRVAPSRSIATTTTDR